MAGNIYFMAPIMPWQTSDHGGYNVFPRTNQHIQQHCQLQYSCDTWSRTLREVCRLKVFENSILRRIFGPKRTQMESGEGSTLRNFIV